MQLLLKQSNEVTKMKCPICQKGEMKKNKDIIEQDGIEFESFKCAKCGEEIMNMKQLKVLANKYRQLRKAKDIVFSKWGNSIAVRIPRDYAADFNISAGKHGMMTKDKEGFKIIPAT